MCGIVGSIGKNNTTAILLRGLEKLEYRGYDSAGIYVNGKNHENYLVKTQGRIANLQEKLTSNIQGTIGIGHTRWATHGKPNQENAHPHRSNNEQFILVHNGVIENFEELKQNFLQGKDLVGDTDTEIIVNLIEYFTEIGKTTKEAFKQTIALIKGSYAFALVDKDDVETIYVAKNKSPLLIGIGDHFNVICSDAMAMLEETDCFMEIADHEMVTVTAEKVVIEDANGHLVHRETYKIPFDLNDLGKGTYPYYMLKEIDEQPGVIRKIIQNYTNENKELTINDSLVNKIKQSDRIYIIACGTSYNAGLTTRSLLEKMMNIPVEVHLASEFGYHMPLLSTQPFFIFLSQSGETADSRQVLVQIRNLGYPSLTLTNVNGSTLSRESDSTLLLYAGPEIAVASTKAYTAQVALLAILAKAVGEAKNNSMAKNFDIVYELGKVASVMETLINDHSVKELVNEYLADTTNAFYIGRGVDYYTALEAALKLKEVSYIQAEGFAAGELKHGTIALIEESTPVIGIITEEETQAQTRSNLKEVESRGANNLIISLSSFANSKDQIIIPDVHKYLTTLVSIVPTQLIAYYAALQKGYDVDKPRNLAKSVTVE